MLFAHISDFHVFSTAPETSLVRLDASEAARKVVENIRTFRPRIEAVMLTGDLTDGGSHDDYALLREILSPLDIPIFVVPGNHDKRANLMAAFPHLDFSNGRFAQYEARFDTIRIIALDTLSEGETQGRLCQNRLDWLETRLAAEYEGLTLILMHHPPFPSGIGPLDRMSLVEGQDRFAALVRDHKGPLRILSGHIHRPYQAFWNGLLCAVAGSPAFQMALEFDDLHEPPAVIEPYAWYVHSCDAANVAVHARYVSI